MTEAENIELIRQMPLIVAACGAIVAPVVAAGVTISKVLRGQRAESEKNREEVASHAEVLAAKVEETRTTTAATVESIVRQVSEDSGKSLKDRIMHLESMDADEVNRLISLESRMTEQDKALARIEMVLHSKPAA